MIVSIAIAASAPVWGFPMDNCPVDSSATVVTYAASEAAGASAQCGDNLKASYVLLSDIGSTTEGRETLSTAMNLCSPLQSSADVKALLSYLQTPLFDLSEGSYPFPSDYITYALTGSTNPLPPWAMQVMCEPLGKDFDVRITGNTSAVDFTVATGGVEVHADWDKTSNNNYAQSDVTASGAPQLLAAVAQAIQVWYNVSSDMPACIDWQQQAYQRVSLTSERELPQYSLSRHARRAARSDGVQVSSATETVPEVITPADSSTKSNTCTLSPGSFDAGTAWNALVCNEGINLVNWWAQGVGNDLYWPPNQSKDASYEEMVSGSLAYCPYLRGLGLYGLPEKGDDWSFWLDTAYGGTRLEYASNIVYSQGNLDPWSPAGVRTDPSTDAAAAKSRVLSRDGSVSSVLIDMGGHHLDLFWPTDQDPDSVR